MKINAGNTPENLYPLNKSEKAKLSPKNQDEIVKNKNANASDKANNVGKGNKKDSAKGYEVDGKRLDSLLKEQSVMENQFRRMILDLLERQGYSLKSLEGMSPEEIRNLEIPVDDEARQEALDLIGPDGPYGVEATSDRIIEFAKVLANKDPSRLPMLRSAIEKGFDAAKSMLGGSLPDISMETHERTMEKFDALEAQLKGE